MKLMHYIYSLLFFLAISKQALAMKNEETSEIENLKALVTKNKSIEAFKTNILEDTKNRKDFLRILSRPYSQKKLNLSLFDINWDIGHLSFDQTKGYETNMIGGMQAGIFGLLQGNQ